MYQTKVFELPITKHPSKHRWSKFENLWLCRLDLPLILSDFDCATDGIFYATLPSTISNHSLSVETAACHWTATSRFMDIELDFDAAFAFGSSWLVPLNSARPKVYSPSLLVVIGWLLVTVYWEGHFDNFTLRGQLHKF